MGNFRRRPPCRFALSLCSRVGLAALFRENVSLAFRNLPRGHGRGAALHRALKKTSVYQQQRLANRFRRHDSGQALSALGRVAFAFFAPQFFLI